MNEHEDYIGVNLRHWNSAVDAHLKSDFYNVKGFLAGACSLNSIELDLLGDVRGKKILHLQCHFGLDTLSLARRGALVTGVDFSQPAIDAAMDLSNTTGLDARFICCNVYDLPNHLDEQFDVVFTSYGTIGWLPDLDAWARVLVRFLKPGGVFVMADFHPVIWMLDNSFSHITYDYFNTAAIVEQESGTYANRDSQVESTNITWNHPMSETIGSLLRQGLQLNRFEEYDYSPYSCFANLSEDQPGQFRFSHIPQRLPMVFGLRASR